MESCPLCCTNQDEATLKANKGSSYPSDVSKLYRIETRKYFWELMGILSLSGIIICLIVDIITGKSFGWALYAVISIFSAWMFLSFILHSFSNPSVLLPGTTFSLLLMLLLFDLISVKANWFIPVGLPLALSASLSAGIVIIMKRKANFRGFNILAAALFSVAVFCILTEIILDNYLFNDVKIQWSLITAVSLFPAILVLLFVHYRMNKGKRLDSFFHI